MGVEILASDIMELDRLPLCLPYIGSIHEPRKDLKNLGKYHLFRQRKWLVLGVKLMEINSNWFSRDMYFKHVQHTYFWYNFLWVPFFCRSCSKKTTNNRYVSHCNHPSVVHLPTIPMLVGCHPWIRIFTVSSRN